MTRPVVFLKSPLVLEVKDYLVKAEHKLSALTTLSGRKFSKSPVSDYVPRSLQGRLRSLGLTLSTVRYFQFTKDTPISVHRDSYDAKSWAFNVLIKGSLTQDWWPLDIPVRRTHFDPVGKTLYFDSSKVQPVCTAYLNLHDCILQDTHTPHSASTLDDLCCVASIVSDTTQSFEELLTGLNIDVL